MADEPDNLVLKMLREMRQILDEHSAAHREHRQALAGLSQQIEDWKETTATGVGFAAHANIRTEALEREIADLKKRVDRLEKAH